MMNTANLGLPLVQAAQAQKHVTVNEGLARLDALTQLTLESRIVSTPPAATDGSAYLVPVGASGDWAGHPGRVAVFSNGGWVFVTPRAGWRAWLRDAGESVSFDGQDWVEGAVAISANGAASVLQVVEIDVPVTSGNTVTSPVDVQGPCVIMGVSGLVTEAITGSLATWRLGVVGGADRYGSGLGLSLGSWVQGLSGQPQAVYGPTPLVLTAEGGDFATGRVRLAVHVFRMTLPRS